MEHDRERTEIATALHIFIGMGVLEAVVERALAESVSKIVVDFVPALEAAGLTEEHARARLRSYVQKACRKLSIDE